MFAAAPKIRKPMALAVEMLDRRRSVKASAVEVTLRPNRT